VRIISADSAAAILDEKFQPKTLIASAAVLVDEPYREAHVRLAEPIFKEVDDSRDVIVHEAQLCQLLLETVQADVVHLDASFGGVPVEELSPVELTNYRVSPKARVNLLKILPKLRRIAGEIRRKHNIDMLAIGKESLAVRVAELTAGAEAVLLAADKVLEDKEAVVVGLPTRCTHHVVGDRVYLQSLIEAEHDVRGYAQDKNDILSGVQVLEMPNPVTRGFRALKIAPKT
jgi:hypothetical protein